MQRISSFILAIVMFVVALSAPCPAIAENARSYDDKKAADEAFKSVVKDVKSGKYSLELTGFDSFDDAERAELAEGFRVFSLDAEKIYADAAPYDPETHVKRWKRWAYLIHLEGQARTLLHISFGIDEKEKLRESFHIGNSPISNYGWQTTKLAKELDGLMSAWPRSAGYQYRIIENCENRMALNAGEISGHPGLRSII